MASLKKFALAIFQGIKSVLRYILFVLIALDQLLNTILGGYPDETLSASAWTGEQQGKLLPRLFRPLIDLLAYPFERDHCRKAAESESLGLQLPNTYFRKSKGGALRE